MSSRVLAPPVRAPLGAPSPVRSRPSPAVAGRSTFDAVLARQDGGPHAVPNLPYAAQIADAAERYGLPPALLSAVVEQESGFNPRAHSAAGASGLTQLMPATARGLGVRDPNDPEQSLDGGAHFLAEQLRAFNGNVELALAAYNAGPARVRAAGGIPPIAETRAYVPAVMARLARHAPLWSAAGYPAPSVDALTVSPGAALASSPAALRRAAFHPISQPSPVSPIEARRLRPRARATGLPAASLV